MGLQLVCDTEAFLFTGQCVAPPPCSCHPTKIECDHKHLTDVPPFSGVRGIGANYIDVNLSCVYTINLRLHYNELAQRTPTV